MPEDAVFGEGGGGSQAAELVGITVVVLLEYQLLFKLQASCHVITPI